MNKYIDNNLNKYLNNVKVIVKRNMFIEKFPHIETTLTIRKADPLDDYLYDDETFADYAFVADWKFTNNSCESSGCYPFYTPAQTCTSNTPPSNVYPGITACGPACYAVPNVTNPFFTRWINNRCVSIDAATVAHFIDPAHRVDPTGRDKYTIKIQFPNDTREFVAQVDENYCKQFGMEYDKNNGMCATTTGTTGYVISFFTGETMIKMFRLGVDNTVDFFANLLASRTTYKQHEKPSENTIEKPSENTIEKPFNVPLKLSEIGIIDNTTEKPSENTTKFKKPFTVPLKLSEIGIIDNTTEWKNGEIVNRRKKREANKDKKETKHPIRPLIDNIATGVIKNGDNIIAGYIVDHTIERAKQYINALSKNVKTMSTVERTVASTATAIRHMTIDRITAQTMVEFAAKLSTASLTTIGIISVIGPVLDVFVELCWDPIHMTFKPMTNADAKKLIQTAAVNRWYTEPVELTPEYAWDVYYGQTYRNENDVIMFEQLNRAYIEYMKYKQTNADGSMTVQTVGNYDETILKYDMSPSIINKLYELTAVANVLAVTGSFIVVGFEKLFATFVMGLIVSVVLSFKVYRAVQDYNKYLIKEHMEDVEYII